MRSAVRIRGQVQGVGFRPFVHRLAHELGLSGWVCNDDEGVAAQVQGQPALVDRFLKRLAVEAPPLARIDAIESTPLAQRSDEDDFRILASREGQAALVPITPDTAVCWDCLSEIFAPGNRRYRYPFTNCTHCGPRYTLTRSLPYDRANTSMASFTMCELCQHEYDDPLDRRFHAQPNACPNCGPQLGLYDGAGRTRPSADPLAQAAALLQDGAIVAIKGLGGFHLACDARQPATVARLRERKNREEKPLAVMVASPASLDQLATCDDATTTLLRGPQAPIMLLRKHARCDAQLDGVAPGMSWLGTMLPYTPLHYLIFYEAAQRPIGCKWLGQPQPLVLVMTSANPGGEPLVTDNAEALRRLHGMADAYLMHDRAIVTRCDDSVARQNGRSFSFIRRARGFTPAAIKLPTRGPSVLACGGWYKNTICVTRGDEAFVSQHIGDLDNAATCAALEQTALHLLDILRITPEVIAHDLHPDFFSTRFAATLAQARNLPTLGVQHHHAHIAAVIAEHRLLEPVVALALDGVGLGTDDSAWGGELLYVDGPHFERLGHLRPLALPGGDRAARQPWRMAASALFALGRRDLLLARFGDVGGAGVGELLARRVNCPLTTSTGRWFDAAAGLLGIRETSSFEAQSAMLLEGLAEAQGPVDPLAGGFSIDEDGTLDLFALLRVLVEEHSAAHGAALFHATLVDALATWAQRAARARSLRTVVLGGGCTANDVLRRGLRRTLESSGLTVYEAQQVPPGDGGLSLGQAWVALLSRANMCADTDLPRDQPPAPAKE